MNILKYLTNRKYRLFYRKYRDVQVAIWEQDFKVAKSKQIREGVRQDRDRSKEAIQNIQLRIDAEKDNTQKANLIKEKLAMESDVSRYEKQMDMIDREINGVKATAEDPGQEGIFDRIVALSELREMYKDYANHL